MKRLFSLIAALLWLAASPVLAAIGTPVSLGTVSDATGFATRSVTLAEAVPPGALIFVVVADSEGACCIPVSVTDTAGNTYTAGTVVPNSSGNLQTRAFYAKNVSALSIGNTITATLATSDPVLKTLHAAYVTGLDAASPADTQGTPALATSASPSASSVNPLAQADEIAFGYVGVESGSSVTFTEAAGFTSLSSTAVSDRLNVAFKVVASTAQVTYAPTMDGSRHWGANVWTFKAAAGGGGGCAPRRALLGVGC